MIEFIVKFLAAYAVTHYSLSTVWDNRTVILVISAILGLLFVLL